jgi:hypothetical protein
MFFPFGQFSLTVYHLRMTGVKFGRIWTSRCIDAEAGLHALMQAVRKDVASERHVLDSIYYGLRFPTDACKLFAAETGIKFEKSINGCLNPPIGADSTEVSLCDPTPTSPSGFWCFA